MRSPAMTWLAGLWLSVLLAAACAPAAPAPVKPAAAPPAAEAAPASAAAPTGAPAPAAPAAAAPARPALVTSPEVSLKVSAVPIGSWATFYIAQDRGYFKEVGLNVEFIVMPNALEAIPSLANQQIDIGNCANALPCFNALNRATNLKIVGDQVSAGRTGKSNGSNALVVRKDLWDNGTIRTPQDLVGRSIYNTAGIGGGPYLTAARWLMTNGVDPRTLDWPTLPFADQFAAMQNKAIEVGSQTEPFVTAGVGRGIYEVMITGDDMAPGGQVLYLMYSGDLDRLGPQVGERFMVGYLRGARDYVNAFEYGVDQDAIIEILVNNTGIKDPAVFKQIKYNPIDPNGTVNRASLQADVDLLYELGIMPNQMDLSPAFDDRYRQFAVQYLGEYQPPR